MLCFSLLEKKKKKKRKESWEQVGFLGLVPADVAALMAGKHGMGELTCALCA